MKIVRYQIDDEVAFGILDNGGSIRRLAGSPFDSLQPTDVTHPLDRVRLLAPVESPRVFGIGLNYVSHVREAGAETPAFPLVFMKPSTAVIGPGEPIVYPRQGQEVHHEAEMAVVIGKPARRVSEAEALDHVLGYTCGNDVSERTIQRAEMKSGALLMGKGFDSFCPLGPCIATDLDPANLDLSGRVNGEVRQQINTSDLLFSVPRLIEYISAAITLLPGDVILTGTPAGVGPIAPGDVVEIELTGVGVLSNPVVAES